MGFNFFQYSLWEFGCEDPKIIKYCQTQYNKYASIGFTIFITATLLSFSITNLISDIAQIPAVVLLLIWLLLIIFLRKYYSWTFYLFQYSSKQKPKRILAGIMNAIVGLPLIFGISFISIASILLKDQITFYSIANNISIDPRGFGKIDTLVKILLALASEEQIIRLVLVMLSMFLTFIIVVPIISYFLTSHKVYLKVRATLNNPF